MPSPEPLPLDDATVLVSMIRGVRSIRRYVALKLQGQPAALSERAVTQERVEQLAHLGHALGLATALEAELAVLQKASSRRVVPDGRDTRGRYVRGRRRS